MKAHVLAIALLSSVVAGCAHESTQSEENAAVLDNALLGSGAYPALMEVDARLPAHVVYRPQHLDRLGAHRLGVVLWGNGGCSDDGAGARFHLSEIASHGFVVIAPGEVLSGPGAPPPRPREPGLAVTTTSADVLAGLDWILAENARPGSPYFGKIDANAVAAAGHSCGGLQALELAADPRVRTALIHNSGVFNDGANPIRGLVVDKSMLQRIHVPLLYVLGGPSDIAYANGVDDFDRLTQVPAALVTADVGHGGTFGEPNGGAAASIAVNWLKWRLQGDRAAAQQFLGAQCGLCSNGAWRIERNALLERESQ